MTRQRKTPELTSKELTVSEMREAIPKLGRRIQELRTFDINSLTDRHDPQIKALKIKIDETLVSIWGHNTIEYNRYSISSLDHAPLVIGGIPLSEAKAGIRKGIENAISKLTTIIEIFQEKLQEQGENPIGKASRAFKELEIHPELQQTIGKLFEDGHYANAIEDACKVLESFVKIRSDKHDLSGTELMQNVFSPKNPILRFNELKAETDQSEQQGMMFLFSGAMLALRNPRAHGLVQDDPEKALEVVAFISYLLKSLDRTKRN